ncbi:unnamed protein product [Linum tenue]|uniref:F-box domain-containing protein n=1 Tax=Linum tenue TaxID=586396 RepID=A0AAV0GQP6_9ROSI|nr:unnamed protein product [Linum tenue]
METTATEIARTEPGTDADDDRLSSLPDEIISHILSFLQTKYAVGTAVLSRRWKDLWARVSNLDLDNTLVYKPLDMQIFLRSLPPVEQRSFQGRKLFAEILGRRELEFCRFADKVLRQHKNLDSVRRFRFRCSVYYRESRLSPDSLFETELVFGPLLEEIDVLICGETEFGFPQCMRCIPESFYTLKNLKVAKLQGVVLGTIEQPVSLPSLKILQLKDVLMNDVKSLGRLISGCTVLETAHLERCSPPNMKLMDTIEACSPYLKNLKIMSESACHDPICPIVIEAPNLEHLHLGRFADLKFKGSSPLSCLHSADVALECCSSWNHAEFALLTQISTAKKIRISAGNLVTNPYFPP